MKKTILIFTVFLCCLQLTGFAQKARVGLTGGVSIANMSKTLGGLDKDGEYRFGIAGGMLVDVPLGKKHKFSFQPSVDYVQKGESEVPLAPINKSYTALRYAEMPLNFVYNLKWGKGVFYLGGGPYMAFNLPSKKVSQIPSNKIETDVSFGDKSTDDLRGIDYGGDVLLGYRMANGIFVSANYTQGARNLYHVEEVPGAFNNKIKNIAFGIRIGFLFKAK